MALFEDVEDKDIQKYLKKYGNMKLHRSFTYAEWLIIIGSLKFCHQVIPKNSGKDVFWNEEIDKAALKIIDDIAEFED